MRLALRQYLDRTVYESIETWLKLLLGIYFAFLVVEPFTLPAELVSVDLKLRLGSFLGTALALILFKRVPVAPKWGPLMALLLGLWAFFITVLDKIYLGDPFFDLYVQLILAASGMVSLRRRVAGLVAAVSLLGWWLVRVNLNSPPALDEIGLLFVALLIGFHCQRMRSRVLCEQWRYRRREILRRDVLAKALKEERETQARLDLEVEHRSQHLSEVLEGLKASHSERETLHHQLLHANRLTAVGRLAAGLAHRLNNQLMVILGNLDCLPETEPVQDMKDAAHRGARLTEQLMPLTGHEFLAPKVTPVSELLEDLTRFLEKAQSPWQLVDEASEASIYVDSHAWFQVMSNLVRNADLANQGAGTIIVRAKLQNDQVVFSVEDEGPGIPTGLREKIFEPFFTTREKGDGTGLGLAIVLGLAHQMEGQLNCGNRREGGAVFSVAFAQTGAASKSEPVESKAKANGLPLRGRALVVEDDQGVRSVLRRHLEALGFEVTGAEHGVEALEKFQKDRFALILSDVMMPQMDGPALIKRVRELDPAVPVLFTSGYPDSKLEAVGLHTGEIPCLAKPYTRKELKCAVEALLNS